MSTMRSVLVSLLIASGCGGPHPGGEIDASVDDIDAAVDGDGNLLVDAPFDAPVDAPGTMPDGPPAMLCAANTWCTETAPAGTMRLFAVHARDSADVLAVGDGGVIIRRRNDVWTAMPSGTTKNLRGVWAANANDAWAVGEGGTALRWNGTTWTAAAGAATNLDYSGVWGSGPNDVWLIGTSTVHHWTGSSWATPVTVPGNLMSVHGTGPNDVWVAGEPSYLKHYTGTWATVMPGGGATQYVVEALTTTNVWSVAPGSGPRNWNGSTWTAHASDAYTDLHAFAANDIWGVAASKAGHWDGSAWTVATPPGVTLALHGVSGAGGHLWIVGAGAKILHRN